MKIYEVGGAVRDALLGEPVTERDWVVIGARPDDLLAAGYRQVGRDFPVFIHPDSGEEYALARTERKVAPGHTGFEFDTSRTITLEEDLERRDLTINAMALDADGHVIDPFGGRGDLNARVLRHVSAAFREDPLRVLRTARFAAKLAHLGFSIATSTVELMRTIGEEGELVALRPERVWQETQKALQTRRPDIYFTTLRECGALARLYPEVDRLFGVPQPEQWHPEIDTGIHTMMALRLCSGMSDDAAVRFAVLTHDLGKGETPPELWPRHHGHGERSAALIRKMSARLPIPRRFQVLADRVARHHGLAHRAAELRPGTLLELLTAVDGLRRSSPAFDGFLLACEADARGRTGLENRPYEQALLLRRAQQAALGVDAATLATASLEGAELGAAIRDARIAAIARALA